LELVSAAISQHSGRVFNRDRDVACPRSLFRAATEQNDTRIAIATLLIHLQILHSFGLPRRKDLGDSAVIGLILLALSEGLAYTVFSKVPCFNRSILCKSSTKYLIYIRECYLQVPKMILIRFYKKYLTRLEYIQQYRSQQTPLVNAAIDQITMAYIH
jgi:hypothetical protein